MRMLNRSFASLFVVTDEVERLENDPVATAPGSDFV